MMNSDDEVGQPDMRDDGARSHQSSVEIGAPDDEGVQPDDFHSHQTAHENFVTVANRILLSKTYFIIYICIIILSLVTMIWTLVDPTPDLFLFWVIEFFIIGSLVFEVGVKLLAVGAKRYFTHWSNWFDLAVIVMVVVTLVLYMHSVHKAKHQQATLEEDLGLAVLIVRNIAMILRILVMIKNQRQLSAENSNRVDFIMLREEVEDRKSMMEGDEEEDDRMSSGSDNGDDDDDELGRSM